MLKATGNRQEPFVYGSLGGGNISLVPQPGLGQPQETASGEIKADYELVQKIGSQRAWEVFLGTHPKGFYADLARAQIEKLRTLAPSVPGNVTVAALPQPAPSSSREATTKETLEWDKVRDSTDPAALQRFIRRFPDSPLSVYAQHRMDVLKQAAQEREEKARADREAAARAAEQARIQAEQKRAEQAAAKKREEDERRAREAEAAEKAKAAAAELAATKKREEEERQAKAAEALQKAKAEEAERKAAEAKLKADQAEREKAAAEAAALREASEKQAREAEAARKKADLAAAQEAACKSEQGKLDELSAKGSEGSGVDDVKSFAKTLTCERLRPLVTATLDKFNVEVAKRAASLPNSPELVSSAQTQLVRLGCLTGEADGMLGPLTKAALGRYLEIEGVSSDDPSVTETLVTELSKHKTRVCPIECKSGEILKGETCVAAKEPAAPATASRSRTKTRIIPGHATDIQGVSGRAQRQGDRGRRAKPRMPARRPLHGRVLSAAGAAAVTP